MSSPETDGGMVRSLEALLGFTVLRLKLTSWVTNSVPPPQCSGGAEEAPWQAVSAADLVAIEQ